MMTAKVSFCRNESEVRNRIKIGYQFMLGCFKKIMLICISVDKGQKIINNDGGGLPWH